MFSNALLSALIAIPFVAQAVLAHDCTRTYTVAQGDTCDSISAAQQVSTYQLAAINSQIDPDCSNLQPGELICLEQAGTHCDGTYVVKDNDICEAISQSTNTPLDVLYANNPQIDDDCFNIYIGEVLCVANTVTVPDVDGDHDVDIHPHGPWANHSGPRRPHNHGGHDDDEDDCEEEEEEEDCEEPDYDDDCEEEEEEDCEDDEDDDYNHGDNDDGDNDDIE